MARQIGLTASRHLLFPLTASYKRSGFVPGRKALGTNSRALTVGIGGSIEGRIGSDLNADDPTRVHGWTGSILLAGRQPVALQSDQFRESVTREFIPWVLLHQAATVTLAR